MTALTPAEAAERRCPMKFGQSGVSSLLENWPLVPATKYSVIGCVGPRCFAWRWMPANPDTDELRRRGYCGLAGRPEDA